MIRSSSAKKSPRGESRVSPRRAGDSKMTDEMNKIIKEKEISALVSGVPYKIQYNPGDKNTVKFDKITTDVPLEIIDPNVIDQLNDLHLSVTVKTFGDIKRQNEALNLKLQQYPHFQTEEYKDYILELCNMKKSADLTSLVILKDQIGSNKFLKEFKGLLDSKVTVSHEHWFLGVKKQILMYFLNYYIHKLYNVTFKDFKTDSDKIFDCLHFDMSKPPFKFKGFMLRTEHAENDDDYEENIYLSKSVLKDGGEPASEGKLAENKVQEAPKAYSGVFKAVLATTGLGLATLAYMYSPLIAAGVSSLYSLASPYSYLFSTAASAIPAVSKALVPFVAKAKDGAILVDDKTENLKNYKTGDKENEKDALLIGKLHKKDGNYIKNERLYKKLK